MQVRLNPHQNTKYIMENRSSKIYANLGFTSRSTKRYVVLLDTEAESSYIRKYVILTKSWNKIKPSPNINVQDANNRKVNTSGTINIAVEIGNKVEMVTLNVVKHLATDLKLGCDYCDGHVEAIKPQQRIMKLDDGASVPIVQNTGGRSRDSVSLSEA